MEPGCIFPSKEGETFLHTNPTFDHLPHRSQSPPNSDHKANSWWSMVDSVNPSLVRMIHPCPYLDTIAENSITIWWYDSFLHNSLNTNPFYACIHCTPMDQGSPYQLLEGQGSQMSTNQRFVHPIECVIYKSSVQFKTWRTSHKSKIKFITL